MNTRSGSTAKMPSNNARFDDLESKLDKILEMHTATNTLMASLVTRVDSIDKKMEVLTGDVHDHAVQLDNHQTLIEGLQKNLSQAMEYIDLLENRQREKNLKLFNVPEQSEKGTDMISFVVKLLETEWGLTIRESDIEKAHRLGALKERARHPRGIIFRVQHLQTKVKILKASKQRQTKDSDTSEEINYRITPDISVQVRRKRDAFWPLRERLHKLNITTKIKYPAVLLVTHGDEEMRFSTPQEAETELNKIFPPMDDHE